MHWSPAATKSAEVHGDRAVAMSLPAAAKAAAAVVLLVALGAALLGFTGQQAPAELRAIAAKEAAPFPKAESKPPEVKASSSSGHLSHLQAAEKAQQAPRLEERLSIDPDVEQSTAEPSPAGTTILRWTGEAAPGQLRHCSLGSCHFASDRSLLPQADALLWQLPDFQLEDVPKERPKGQLWAGWLDEAPCGSPLLFSGLSDLFDIILSTSPMAEVHLCPPVGNRILESLGDLGMTTRDKDAFRQNGTNLVAFLTCGTSREGLAADLEAHGVKVDMIENCLGEGRWSNNSSIKDTALLRRYKFALWSGLCACRDFVPEELFQLLGLGVVPLVKAHGLDSLLPHPGAVINTSLFSTVAELASELKRLDKDTAAYESHLSWKRRSVSRTPLGKRLERCTKLDDLECKVCDEVITRQKTGQAVNTTAVPRLPTDCSLEAGQSGEIEMLQERLRQWRAEATHLTYTPRVSP